MLSRRRASFRFAWLGLLVLLGVVVSAACVMSALPGQPTPTPTPAPATAIPTPVPAPTIPPTPTIPPDWASVAPGVELRALPIPAEGKSSEAVAVLLRVDPAQVDVKILLDKDTPARVSEWQTRLGALAVINAGYFQEDYTPAGLLVVEGGGRYGLSFDADGLTPGASEGMFSISGGVMRIRALAAQPYDPAEPIDQGVQGLPALVDGGAAVAFDLPDRAARRTAVALDAGGRLLLIHVYSGAITLPRLRDWLLTQTDLGIVSALNLDGGTSTGLTVSRGPWPVNDDSVSKVPSILAVMAR